MLVASLETVEDDVSSETKDATPNSFHPSQIPLAHRDLIKRGRPHLPMFPVSHELASYHEDDERVPNSKKVGVQN